MRHRLALLLLASLPGFLTAAGWSRKSHQSIASIAQARMSAQTYIATVDLLDGDNIVYWAAWLDGVRGVPEYAFTSTWHYINVDAGREFEERNRDPNGDALDALDFCYAILTDPQSRRADLQDALKIAVHVIGDLHQPLHCGHKSDLGGNTITLTYEGAATNLHSLWDYTIVEEAHGWTYYEWRENLLPPAPEEEEAAEGTHYDWARQTVEVADAVYRYFKPGMTVTASDVEHWTPTVERQILLGGLRLARWLDEAVGARSALSPAQAEEEAVDVYTPTGVCVATLRPSDFRTRLSPGLYIASGRKILITP